MRKIMGMIPARYNSKRVKQKNLRLIAGKPLIQYTIETAKKAKTLTEVYVNTESDVIGKIAVANGVKYYKRDPLLSTDTSTLDEFNYDFIKGTDADVLVMVNPVCPLIETVDIDNVVRFFLENNYDTVITVLEERLQAFCNGKPINFDTNSMLPKTQDISPIQICVWSVCVWNAKTFLESFEEKGYAIFSGKVGFYPLSFLKSIKISTEEDFLLAEELLLYKKENEKQ